MSYLPVLSEFSHYHKKSYGRTGVGGLGGFLLSALPLETIDYNYSNTIIASNSLVLGACTKTSSQFQELRGHEGDQL